MTAQTGAYNSQSFDDRAAYGQSFGFKAHKTVYYQGARGHRGPSRADGLKSQNGFNTVDLREELGKAFSDGFKAHTTQAGGAGTAGYAMIPIFVDPVIVDETRKYTPLVEMIPRVTNQGTYADYNNITAKGGGFTRGEGADLSAQDNTYDRNSTQIKYLYAVGSVTGPSQAGQPAYILQGLSPQGGWNGGFSNQSGGNAKQQEVLVQTRAIKELEENLIINGNATTSAISGNPDGTEFDGIVTLMGATNTVDKNTTALALSDLTKAVRYAYDDGGRPNLGVCSSSVYEDIENLLLAKFGYLQSEKSVFWGFETIVLRTMVGQIPIVPSMYLSNASGSKAIYFLDLSVVEMRVLQDLTYEDLAKTNDSNKFMLKIYEALIIRNTAFCSSVTEISA